MSIRAATLDDADEIDRVHVQAWQRAYWEFIAPEDMIGARTPQDERVALWRERLAAGQIRSWVYEVEGEVAGFVSAGAGELWALYVDPKAQGAGVGSALLAHAEDELRAEGADEAKLWVFIANEPGRRFYETRGWELVPGTEDPADYVSPGVCYRKRL